MPGIDTARRARDWRRSKGLYTPDTASPGVVKRELNVTEQRVDIKLSRYDFDCSCIREGVSTVVKHLLATRQRLGLESDNNQSHMYQLAARTLKESKCVHFSTAHHSQGFFKQLKNFISLSMGLRPDAGVHVLKAGLPIDDVIGERHESS
ncbi:hypothetical protein J6590_077020 [Homalodisca vitripennis]|nr:hypothetical protein J6590_077020 [Homalodisca vitripennis]